MQSRQIGRRLGRKQLARSLSGGTRSLQDSFQTADEFHLWLAGPLGGEKLIDETEALLLFGHFEIVALLQDRRVRGDEAELFLLAGHKAGKPVAVAFLVLQVKLRVQRIRNPYQASGNLHRPASGDEHTGHVLLVS